MAQVTVISTEKSHQLLKELFHVLSFDPDGNMPFAQVPWAKLIILEINF